MYTFSYGDLSAAEISLPYEVTHTLFMLHVALQTSAGHHFVRHSRKMRFATSLTGWIHVRSCLLARLASNWRTIVGPSSVAKKNG